MTVSQPALLGTSLSRREWESCTRPCWPTLWRPTTFACRAGGRPCERRARSRDPAGCLRGAASTGSQRHKHVACPGSRFVYNNEIVYPPPFHPLVHNWLIPDVSFRLRMSRLPRQGRGADSADPVRRGWAPHLQILPDEVPKYRRQCRLPVMQADRGKRRDISSVLTWYYKFVVCKPVIWKMLFRVIFLAKICYVFGFELSRIVCTEASVLVPFLQFEKSQMATALDTLCLWFLYSFLFVCSYFFVFLSTRFHCYSQLLMRLRTWWQIWLWSERRG